MTDQGSSLATDRCACLVGFRRWTVLAARGGGPAADGIGGTDLDADEEDADEGEDGGAGAGGTE
jgi:hypothetical protein